MGLHTLTEAHSKGAANEHIAAAWYLQRGCQVYWPAVPSGPVDFVVGIEGKLVSVQVKSATWNANYNQRYLQCRACKTGTRPQDLYDVLVVVGDGDIWQIPASAITSPGGVVLRSTNPNYVSPLDKYRLTKSSPQCSCVAGSTS